MDVIDLTDALPQESIRYEVLKPGTTTGTGWFIDIAYSDHEKAQTYANRQARKKAKRDAAIETQQANGRKVKAEERDPDEARRENVGWVASRLVGWTPVRLAFIQEEPIEFSDENAMKVLMHPKMNWLFSQLVDVISDEKSFTKPSPKP